MAQLIKITQKQAPQFRALIKSADSGDFFDPATDLATAAELQPGETLALNVDVKLIRTDQQEA